MSLHKKALECGITSSCREENVQLFKRIIAGNKAAQRLVEGNMGYVVKKVKCFLDEYPGFRHLKDDLISEGFLVLTYIASTLKEVAAETFDPQALISVSLRNAFVKLIKDDRYVPFTDSIAANLKYDATPAIDMRLDILSCCQNETEERIVQLRWEGLVDRRIAPLVGRSPGNVAHLRQQIFKRFQETR